MEHAYTGRVRAGSNREADALLAAYDDAVSELGLEPERISVRSCTPSPGTVSTHESLGEARAVLRRCTDLRLHPDVRYADDTTAVALGADHGDERYAVDVEAVTRDAADAARDVVEDAFGIEMRRPGIATRAQDMVADLYSRVHD